LSKGRLVPGAASEERSPENRRDAGASCLGATGETAISHTNRNFVIAYILLVGLPLLGLVGILRGGRSLTAPFSVDGAWKIESGVSRLPASPCGNFLSLVSNAPLSISQSGKSLVVTLTGGTKTTTGTLDGKTVRAQFAGTVRSGADKSGAAACGDGSLTLAATLDPLAEPRTLSGTLSIEGCGSCTPLEFHAVRQPKSPGGTR
jgi:hypothetical protein